MRRLVGILVLSLVGLLPAAAEAQVATGTIVGFTTPNPTSSGPPPAQVSVGVRVYDLDRHLVAQGGPTGLTGDYSITVPAGTYYVLFFASGRDGFGRYVPELNANARTWPTATTVTVPAGGSVTANASLEAMGRMAGRVVDQSGTPVSGCTVFSLAVGDDPIFYDAASTGAGGTYSLGGLRGGDSRVAADCGAGYAPVIAPGVVTIPGTTTVAVPDIVVPRASNSISGIVTTDAGTPMYGACVVAFSTAGAVLGAAPMTSSSGQWSIADLSAGPVRLGVIDCYTGVRFIGEWYEDAATFAAATNVTVSATAPTTGVEIAVTPYVGLGAIARNSGGTSVGGSCMWVTDTTGTVLVGAAYVFDGGNGVRVTPGDYKVLFTDCGGGWASVWYHDAADVASATVVHVGETQTTIEQTLHAVG